MSNRIHNIDDSRNSRHRGQQRHQRVDKPTLATPTPNQFPLEIGILGRGPARALGTLPVRVRVDMVTVAAHDEWVVRVDLGSVVVVVAMVLPVMFPVTVMAVVPLVRVRVDVIVVSRHDKRVVRIHLCTMPMVAVMISMMVVMVVVVMMTMTVARTPLMRARVVVVPGYILVERVTAVMTVSAHVNAVPGNQVLVVTVHSSVVPVEIEVERFQIALVSMMVVMTTSLELTRTRHKSRQGQLAKRRFLLQPNKPRSDAQFANYKEELTLGGTEARLRP
jgi:hypothetical protein